MTSFIIRRFASLLPLLLAVTMLAAVLMYLSPGDVLTKMRADPGIPRELIDDLAQRYGLVDAEGHETRWYERYGAWISRVLQGDFGESITYRIPVVDLLAQRVPATFLLSLTSVIFAWTVAVPLGVLAAIRKDSIFDKIASFLAYAALSIPEFFLAILAVYFASVSGLFPVGGSTSIGSEYASWPVQWGDRLYHLILPTLVLGLAGVASMMRIMRANFIDYMRQDFARAARAKGLTEKVIMFKHVLRNAINPLVTAMGFAFASLLSGALLVENIMNYPGLGQLVFSALLEEDQFVVMSALLVSTAMLVFGNMIADVLLAWSDPRVRLERRGTSGHGLSSRTLIFVYAAIFAVIGLEIAFEALLPQYIPAAITVIKYSAMFVGALIILSCLCLAGYVLLVLIKRHLKPILARPMGVASLAVLVIMYTMMLFADFVAPYDMATQNLTKAFHPPTGITWSGGPAIPSYEIVERKTNRYEAVEGAAHPLRFFVKTDEPYPLFGFIPCSVKLFGVESGDADARVYLMGSDSLGRDIFSRLLYGSQISLTIGLIGISITLTLAFIVGGMAGYFGGTFDFVSMRLIELLMSIPSLYLLLSLRSALFQPGLSSTQVYLAIIAILAIIGWAGAARVVRGMSMSIRNRAFVVAAESMGQPAWRILYKHILPNLASYLLVAATLSIPGYILGEAALSFLGLGITEPSASWGLMLKQSQADMKVFFLNFYWLLAPGAAIFVTVIAFNVFGDVLRDVVDPRGEMK